MHHTKHKGLLQCSGTSHSLELVSLKGNTPSKRIMQRAPQLWQQPSVCSNLMCSQPLGGFLLDRQRTVAVEKNIKIKTGLRPRPRVAAQRQPPAISSGSKVHMGGRICSWSTHDPCASGLQPRHRAANRPAACPAWAEAGVYVLLCKYSSQSRAKSRT